MSGSDEQDIELPIRLALRVEGDYWNAYFAETGTMENAELLGSIRMDRVQSPERKAQFHTFMQDVLADTIEERCGFRPVFPKEATRAPEHERAGRA